MEKSTEKIRRFSRVVYVLLQISFVASIVGGAFLTLFVSWPAFDLPMKTVEIGGRTVETAVLFQLGNTTVSMPFVIAGSSNLSIFSWNENIPSYDFTHVLSVVVFIIALAFAKRIFKILREEGSPFREDVVKGLKSLAIALLCSGLVTGGTGIIAAGVVWVLCLIFDYGRALQAESDTTL